MTVFHSMILQTMQATINQWVTLWMIWKEVANVNGYSESEIGNLVRKHSNKIKDVSLLKFLGKSGNGEMKRWVLITQHL